MPLDDLDARLLELLADDARIGVMEASRRLGVARGTVQARLDKLVAREVIADFGPTVRPARLGYPVLAFLSLQIAQGLVAEAVDHLRTLPEVLEVHGTSGSSDLLCRVAARSTDHLQEVIATVLTSPAVQRTDTSVVLSTQIPYRVEPLIRAAPRQDAP
jgi:DNA-binding Lrp family transcriptional regulator